MDNSLKNIIWFGLILIAAGATYGMMSTRLQAVESKQMQLEEMDRNAKSEERKSESIARDDDVGFKESDFINTELVEVVEKIQNKIIKEDK